MKKLLTFLFLFVAILSFGQDVRPSGMLTIQSPGFYYYQDDTTVWIYKGSALGWTKLASHRDVQHKIDSLSTLGYTKIEVNNLLALKLNKSASDTIVYILNTAINTKLSSEDATIAINALNADIAGKVDKVTGKSLVLDTEIAKIHTAGSDNQDLSEFYSTMYEKEVTASGTTTYTIPFTLREKTLVYYNGILLRATQWQGIGTTNLTIGVNPIEKDFIKIQN